MHVARVEDEEGATVSVVLLRTVFVRHRGSISLGIRWKELD
jgi:hypothetical protein